MGADVRIEIKPEEATKPDNKVISLIIAPGRTVELLADISHETVLDLKIHAAKTIASLGKDKPVELMLIKSKDNVNLMTLEGTTDYDNDSLLSEYSDYYAQGWPLTVIQPVLSSAGNPNAFLNKPIQREKGATIDYSTENRDSCIIA